MAASIACRALCRQMPPSRAAASCFTARRNMAGQARSMAVSSGAALCVGPGKFDAAKLTADLAGRLRASSATGAEATVVSVGTNATLEVVRAVLAAEADMLGTPAAKDDAVGPHGVLREPVKR
eukprot:gnl/TRDRNA2_/TRDRNA2_91352_c0_seq1.p3 gnl/TRDRNA2_/TRDRNA2_91352_c0~~gnl/TRDRNA2_/TRDRNA2_91352_c0_seq1.p3  ORF type:complete len:123 (-),score=27.99 gnl/TRDRNA2_/TRDRNA2_91352_c0_seq1:39-407(-)